MKSVYIYEAVRKAHYRDKKGIRQIVRELGIARNTVRKILAEEESHPPEYRLRKPKSKPVLDPVIPLIDAWLAKDAQEPRKQQHTAQRIYERLREEYGFTGSDRRIREYVAEWRKRPKEVFLPLAFEPGEMAQVDWAEVTIELEGVRRKIQLFCLVLNYSGAFYCEAFERANQESFFQGHANAFAFLGGVPRAITYDNLTSAVKKILEGKNRQENERFVAFRSGYLFDSRFCNPARGNEKGRIENMVKYAERNFFVPVPQVEDLLELNQRLQEACVAYQQKKQAHQEKTVADRLQEEQRHLLPLPIYPPECCRLVPVKADKFALVQFETNRYSVPSQAGHLHLWLKAFPTRIEISNQHETIARHERLYGRYQEAIQASHYQQMLARKPGGRKHLRAVGQTTISSKAKTVTPSPYPQVHVQSPDLSKYRQLLRQ